MSATPSSTPVFSNVPSLTQTLFLTSVSTVDLVKKFRMPSLGSTAVITLTELANEGCESRARVKTPVPEPILFVVRDEYRNRCEISGNSRAYSTMVNGSDVLIQSRM